MVMFFLSDWFPQLNESLYHRTGTYKILVEYSNIKGFVGKTED